MTQSDLTTRYNYAAFTQEKFQPWMRFSESPAIWQPAPDFPLWNLDQEESQLSAVWSSHLYTVVEFGSFT